MCSSCSFSVTFSSKSLTITAVTSLLPLVPHPSHRYLCLYSVKAVNKTRYFLTSNEQTAGSIEKTFNYALDTDVMQANYVSLFPPHSSAVPTIGFFHNRPRVLLASITVLTTDCSEKQINKQEHNPPPDFHFLFLYNAMHHQYLYSQEDQRYKHTDASSPPYISYPEIKKKKKEVVQNIRTSTLKEK